MEKLSTKSKIVRIKIDGVLTTFHIQFWQWSREISGCCITHQEYLCSEWLLAHDKWQDILEFEETNLIPDYLKNIVDIYSTFVSFKDFSNYYDFTALIDKIESIVVSFIYIMTLSLLCHHDLLEKS